VAKFTTGRRTPAAEADEYLVQVSTTEDFSADVRDYVTADTSIVLPNGSVNTGTRYVRVLARNTNGDTASNTIAIRVINPCRIDFNGDGNKTTLDLIEFINGFRGSACQ